MAGKHFQLSTGSLFLTWLIAAIVVLLLPASVTDKAPLSFYKVFMPVLGLGQKSKLAVTETQTNQDAITQAEYDKLWKNFQNTHAQLLQLHQEYELLSQIKSGLPQPFSELVLARVTNSVNSFSHEIIINKGEENGVKVGQYVLSAGQNNIVGIIDQTGKQLAKVRLLTDAGQKIPVQIIREGQSTGIGGLMLGDGKMGCKIANIQGARRVDVGDAVFARVHPGLLNAPVIIGTVSEVKPDEKHPLLWDISVKPVEDMSRLQDVAVIVVEDF